MNDIKRDFAKRLHKAISERGIKQVELAHAVGVPATTVSGWFRGVHSPDYEKLVKLCSYLGMSVSELVEDKPSDKRGVAHLEIMEDPECPVVPSLVLKELKRCGVKSITLTFG